MVDQLSTETPNCSPANVQVESIVSTTPLFENRDFLNQKYTVEGLSARQIAVLIGCAHSTINDALERFSILKKRRDSGHIPYGYKLENGRRVRHVREHKVVNQILLKKNRGWSNAKIADWLNTCGIRSPAGRVWYPATIGRLVRLAARKAR